MIITNDDKELIKLIKEGSASIFCAADYYPDKQKFWSLMGMLELINLSVEHCIMQDGKLYYSSTFSGLKNGKVVW